jgi:hypothetical protein
MRRLRRGAVDARSGRRGGAREARQRTPACLSRCGRSVPAALALSDRLSRKPQSRSSRRSFSDAALPRGRVRLVARRRYGAASARTGSPTWSTSASAREAGPRRRRHRRLLLRSARPLAARLQREHRRAAAPVLPEGTDFSTGTEAELYAVADELNAGPASAWASPTRTSNSPSCCCNDRSNPPIRLRHGERWSSPRPRASDSPSAATSVRRDWALAEGECARRHCASDRLSVINC